MTKIACLLASATILIVFTLISSSCATSNSTIRCYICNSYDEPACADIEANDNATNSKLLHKCEPRHGYNVFCRKTVQTILDVQKIKRVSRYCGWLKNNRTDCRRADTDFKLETTCQCFTNGCNAGRRNQASGATWHVAVALVAYQLLASSNLLKQYRN